MPYCELWLSASKPVLGILLKTWFFCLTVYVISMPSASVNSSAIVGTLSSSNRISCIFVRTHHVWLGRLLNKSRTTLEHSIVSSPSQSLGKCPLATLVDCHDSATFAPCTMKNARRDANRRSQKFSPRWRPPSRGRTAKNYQLEMVATFTYRPSLGKIDACNFELSW